MQEEENIATNEEKEVIIEIISKRVAFTAINIKRMKLIATAQESDFKDMKEKEIFDIITNRAIEAYFKSDEIKTTFDI
ncbi:MAG: hypothetical protein Q9M43_16060 [Sulfurimonas sp.]|nr:hypothetical protein [Sulfurimonas sp.]